jgi:hypothetical protein
MGPDSIGLQAAYYTQAIISDGLLHILSQGLFKIESWNRSGLGGEWVDSIMSRFVSDDKTWLILGQ